MKLDCTMNLPGTETKTGILWKNQTNITAYDAVSPDIDYDKQVLCLCDKEFQLPARYQWW